jgi:hypothetical protein
VLLYVWGSEGGEITFAAGPKGSAAGPVFFQAPSEIVSDRAYLDAHGATRWIDPAPFAAPAGDTIRYVCLAPALAPNQTRTFELTAPKIARPKPFVEARSPHVHTVRDSTGALFATFTDQGFRKPVLWPLLSESGRQVTSNGPSDHIHHRSFWFTHGHVNGRDFWSEGPKSGTTKIVRSATMCRGVVGEIRAVVDWLANDGSKVCEDERTLRFYDMPEGAGRLIDFEIAFHPQDGDLAFGDDKEGVFGVRVAPSMAVDQKSKNPGGELVNAEGLKNAAVWGKKSAWCDYSGPVDGKTVGIAIFDHPDNLRHPTTWHARTYGLFCANPFGLKHFLGKGHNGEHRVPKGATFRLKYRVYIHEGAAAAAKVGDYYSAYATPPKVSVRIK